MSESWVDEQTERIAAEIKRLRGRRSRQWLADRISDLGHDVSPAVIADLETGMRKSITVAELLIIAAALGTPPGLLLFPDYPDGYVEVLPDLDANSESAVEWLAGDGLYALETGTSTPTSYVVNPHPLVEAVRTRRAERGEGDSGIPRLLAMIDPSYLTLEQHETLERYEQRQANHNEVISGLGGTVNDG